jgi:hypothetical protein
VTAPQSINDLEAQVASDMHRYDEIERLEAELIETILPQGFGAAGTEIRYRAEKDALANSIRKGKEMLAAARSHPRPPHE